ncbi:Crp/Fnr family transcriptional regulator [uncultured Flavobacterium sp.]|uniref:Crp/Fnr family transcriptional regulator n=1 Tax=uncultured Flavobacterium sp. TaxID=165435 RepID=UPI000A567D32|nr:Crp/Fnr family transcriptional regulator [uncultured Flavobacterium sp.]
MTITSNKISFFDSISPFVKLSSESKNTLLSLMLKQELQKGHVLVPTGNICTHVYYIEKGLARTFYIKDSKEITEKFALENSFTCSINSYVTQKADGKQIELLEPSTVWSLPYKKLEELYDKYHDIERMGRHLITVELTQVHKRLSSLQFMSAQERYNDLITYSPELLQRVPLGIISSYLGITQETLSRIRTKI